MKVYTEKILQNSILPLCHGYEKPTKSIKETLGNAIVFAHEEGVWLLTCRHLIDKPWEEDSMIKSVKLADRANYFMMWNQTDNLRFHPADSEEQTLDLALYYFTSTDQFQPEMELLQWDSRNSDRSPEEGDNMMVMGIRSEKMTPESVVSSKPLPVTTIEGEALDNTLRISPEDDKRTFLNQRAVKVGKDQLAELAGGLVAAKTEDGWFPQGIITGTGTVTLKMTKEAAPEEVGIYTYTDFRYLNEMLEPVNQ